MDWNPSTLWWLAAGALVALELTSGTFYLLMVALGCAAGALAAQAGLGATAQLLGAALVGVGCTVLWHLQCRRAPRAAPAESNADVNLDIGQTVQVPAWQPDGTARVHYRGADWSVRLEAPSAARPGAHVIVGVHGSELRLVPATTR